MTQPAQFTPEKNDDTTTDGIPGHENGTGSCLAVTEKNGGDSNQKDNPDNLVSPEHQPCAESIGGAQQ
eukprot:1000619-Ditylum_brightwellii.AAC.1